MAILATLLAVGCGGTAGPQALGTAPADLVAGHSAGYISTESALRVRFTQPMVDPDRVNEPLDPSPFSARPAIEGVTVWSEVDVLELRPAERLPAGRKYTVTVDLASLAEVEDGGSSFSFEVTTMEQSFEVQVDGLQAVDPKALDQQRLTGTLTTADVADSAAVEKALRASHLGNDLPITWEHDPSRTRHRFVVDGIVRSDDEQTLLELGWDGSAIGVDRTDSTTLPVPPLSSFAVTQVRAIQGRERCIEVRFTDPLDPEQNLDGLVRVEGKDRLRFTIEDNIVRVYASTGWKPSEQLRVEPGVRNSIGYRLRAGAEHEVAFETLKPQVRFANTGTIIPSTHGLTIPVETVNVRSLVVEAMQVYDTNLPQFLQVNDYDGDREMKRVGRVVWKRTMSLDITPDKENRWVRTGLDLTPLVEANPGGLYRLQLSFRRNHIVYECGAAASDDLPEDLDLGNLDEEQEASYWDWWENDSGESHWDMWQHRNDPCHRGYYREFYDHDIRAHRNVLLSDLGLMAKAGSDGSMLVIATDLRTAQPLRGADVKILDYQQQVMAEDRTDSGGLANLEVEDTPFLAVVRHGDDVGYLKLDDGSALSMAHCDVAGASVSKGLKGYLYGERGVWRPGDTLHLTFILLDSEDRIPDTHPVRLELRNSRGQLVASLVRTRSLNGFYSFPVTTDADAPTGTYTARVMVGGATFEKTLRVETVMPNRLKIAFDLGAEMVKAPRTEIDGTLSATWLHGAIAKNLRADMELTLRSGTTRFKRWAEYSFDDPTRSYEPQSQVVFDGTLDEQGTARVSRRVEVEDAAPGMLTASLATRVFEPGGAFSIDRFSVPFSPYTRYVGVRTPRGDAARGMLLTDQKHQVDLVTVDQDGAATGSGEVKVELYKIEWRWWWEKGQENLPDYAGSTSYTPLASDTVRVRDGVATWSFEVKYPDWGRYLVIAEDTSSGHRAGRIVYVDWPGWAGRGQKEQPGGASVLTFTADKEGYAVGERVTLTIPTSASGRGLVSLESGSRVLRTEWVQGTGEPIRYSFEATAAMTPNIYAHVTFLQPHLQAGNDLPIRTYGVIPITVEDRRTRLRPVVKAPEVFAPEESGEIKVSEADGRPMTYTVAVVDEGLLGLTRFATPDPWDHFYQREALGVRTWDLFDNVAAAYGAAFERLLAVGGDEDGGASAGAKRANRFPPMVRFLGPFELKKGATNTHQVEIPQYLGAVRVMVVAGQDGAFGATDTSVFVRKPLMVLGTLPRVLGPDEKVRLPVAVFALEPKVKNVTVSVATGGPLQVEGASEQQLVFSQPGDDLAGFELRTLPSPGVATVTIEARGGGERIRQEIELDVRPAASRVTDVVGTRLEPGATWEHDLTLPGMAGTNEVLLEVSRIPPIDLGRRLEFLIRYPHGCIEQTVSSVFPQVYLDQLVDLSPEKSEKVQENVRAGIERMKSFQTSDGGFAYWPGQPQADPWGSSYGGHFLVEAERAGYRVPAGVLEQWKGYQRGRANAWVTGPVHSELMQAYRLFTLALAGDPQLGAMNRLRETSALPAAALWRLAVAYHLAGQPETAQAMVGSGTIDIKPYRELSGTYGSDLRDKAMVLEALLTMGRRDAATALQEEVAAALSGEEWLSTQTTAHALIAMARAAGLTPGGNGIRCAYSFDGGREQRLESDKPLLQEPLTLADSSAPGLSLTNSGDSAVYPRLVLSGVPRPGSERAASNGLELEVQYETLDGDELDVSSLEQGTDFKVVVMVKNTGRSGAYEEVALSYLVASGWEIHNERMDPQAGIATAAMDYQDIRDDRVYTYFDIGQGEEKSFELLLNAAYLGRYYLPLVQVEAMYDATINGRAAGRWVEVVRPGS